MSASRSAISRGPLIGLALGIAAVTALFVWQGLESVYAVLQQAGWSLLLLCLLEPLNQLLAAEAWRALFPRASRPPVGRALWASWMGHAVNLLLPVAGIGGEVVKARVLTLWRYSAIDAYSTMVVDKTVQATTVLLWGLIGVGALVVTVPDDSVWIGAGIGAAVFAIFLGSFVAMQILGSFSALARIASKIVGPDRIRRMTHGAQSLDSAIRSIYRRPTAFVAACGWLMLRQVWLISDVLLASYLIGQPLGIGEAILLKALVTALVAFAFAVPAGIGVQEAGFVLVGGLIGLPPDMMLALSLASRVREVLPAIPCLIAWQNMERRAILDRRRDGAARSEA